MNLEGVQEEQDLARRNAVRKKTTKYLQKAERIYRINPIRLCISSPSRLDV